MRVASWRLVRFQALWTKCSVFLTQACRGTLKMAALRPEVSQLNLFHHRLLGPTVSQLNLFHHRLLGPTVAVGRFCTASSALLPTPLHPPPCSPGPQEFAIYKGQAEVFDVLVSAGAADIAKRGAAFLPCGADSGFVCGGEGSTGGETRATAAVATNPSSTAMLRRSRMLSQPASYSDGVLIEACGMPVICCSGFGEYGTSLVAVQRKVCINRDGTVYYIHTHTWIFCSE